MTVSQLKELAQSPIEVRSGYNGKILCKEYIPKKHKAISEREVITIWTEIRANKSCGGYSSIATPIICVHVHGDVEFRAEMAKREV